MQPEKNKFYKCSQREKQQVNNNTENGAGEQGGV